MNKQSYQQTLYCCFRGYVVHAVVNNFAPLLFLRFESQYGIPLSRITFLITANYIAQLIMDLLSAFLADRIGYRNCMIAAHISAAAGFLGMAVLPELISPYAGLLISVVLCGIGGGLLEVLLTPIVEACPAENKERYLSFLHASYCWGFVAVILLSTAFFALFGLHRWRTALLLWSILPVVNGILFARVPIITQEESHSGSMPRAELIRHPQFILFIVMMICAGASEQAVGQWASAFAESALGVSKTAGDLLGPMLFAAMMGLTQTYYALKSERIRLRSFMFRRAVLCAAAYLMIVFGRSSVSGLAGIGLVGLCIGIMWPGTFILAAEKLPRGGTAMFALMALAGDIGCALGPTAAGMVSSLKQGNMRAGILGAVVFPVILSIILFAGRERNMK